MSVYSIPVLDLNDYTSGNPSRQQLFVNGVGTALREVGFFALTNHGISSDLISRAYEEVQSLFALDTDVKKRYEVPGINGQRGYTSFGKEHAKDSKAPDLKEFWHVGQELSAKDAAKLGYPGNIWPTELPNFRTVMMDIYRNLEASALSILEACSRYIGESPELLRDIARDGNSILRLIHYPPIPADRNPSSIRAAAHEDINLITLLIDATASGLELLDRSGNWIPVVTPKGCIIVDAGDMLQNISNGFFKSTTHRVVNPDNSRDPRYSMPFFVHARGEVSLNPLASCIERTGGKAQFPNLTAGEYLMQRLKEIGLA